MSPPKLPPDPAELPRAIAGDEQPERDAVRHPGVDGVEQARPARVGTLPGMPALKPPPLPGELAPTKPAPNPLRHDTIRRPSPPSTVALARRSDPPAPVDTPPPQTPASPHLDATLPPPSSGPNEAALRAQRRALAAKSAELELARAEKQKLELQLELAKQAAAAAAAAPARPWLDDRLSKAIVGLLSAMTALGAPLTIWLTAKATALEHAQQRQDKRAEQATATATSAKAESSSADKELAALKEQLAAERAYNREIWRRMGVQIPKRAGDPDAPEIKAEAPLRKPGTVTPGPVLVVQTPPP